MGLHRDVHRSILFEVVIDTIIRGWLFPSFLCITQVLTISSVRGSLCGQDVVRSRRACFVCDLDQIPRFPSELALSVVGIEVQVPSQSGHGTTCIYPVVVGEMHLHSHPTGMIWKAGLTCIFFRLEACTEMTDCGQLGLS